MAKFQFSIPVAYLAQAQQLGATYISGYTTQNFGEVAKIEIEADIEKQVYPATLSMVIPSVTF